jgi:ABC-type lipoprotein release transport system permease subunit
MSSTGEQKRGSLHSSSADSNVVEQIKYQVITPQPDEKPEPLKVCDQVVPDELSEKLSQGSQLSNTNGSKSNQGTQDHEKLHLLERPQSPVSEPIQMVRAPIREKKSVSGIFGTLWLFMKISWIDYTSRCCLSIIAILSIALCIIVTMLAQGLISKVPIVFYSSTSANTGELDIIISDSNQQLNGTTITALLNGVTPTPPAFRVITTGLFTDNLNGAGLTDKNVTCNMIFLDIDFENRIGLGAKDKLIPLPDDEIYISQTAALTLNLKDGQQILVTSDYTSFLKVLVDTRYQRYFNATYPINAATTTKNLQGIFKVRIFDETVGSRFADDGLLKYSALFNIKTAMNILANNISRINPAYSEYARTIDLREYADLAIIQFKDRMDLYLSGNYDTILATAVPLASDIVALLGSESLTLTMPLVSALSFTKFANAVISLMFNMIMVGVILLAAYVINNIINMTISSKTYYTAIQRTIGLSRNQLVGQITVFSLGFTVFGVLFALPFVAWIFNYMNTKLLPGLNAGFSINAEFRNTSISALVAILIPFASSIYPMLDLMYQNIAFSLDKDHSKTSSVRVTIENTHDAFPWTIFSLALFSALNGIFIQVFLPISMASLNITMFFTVFFFLLGSLLFGLLFLFLNFSYLYEYFILKVVIFFEKNHIQSLSLMNLISHRLRNRNTVLIYSLSLAFINFLYVTLIMQTESSQQSVLKARGGTFVLIGPILGSGWQKIISNITIPFQWTPITSDLSTLTTQLNLTSISLSNRGGIISTPQKFASISPEYIEFTPANILSVASSNQQTSLTPSQFLYTRFAAGSGIMSESLRSALDINCLDASDTFTIKLTQTQSNFKFLEQSCGYSLNRISGFVITNRPGVISTTFNIFSHDHYLSLMEDLNKPYESLLNYSRILIKVPNQADELALKDQFTAVSYDYGFSIFYFEQFKKRFASTNSIMDLIFVVMTILCLSLSLFSLISTMSANIVEQSKELAILRCVGLSKFAISRVFMYESVVVILTGAFIGLVVGVSLGWTMVAQNSLFAGTDPSLSFPWSILITVIIFSFVSSLIAAGIPTYLFLRRNIVTLVKSMG